MTTDEYRIEFFDPTRASENVWEKLFELKLALHWDLRSDPDDLPLPKDSLKSFMLNPDPHHTHYQWIAWNNDHSEMVGFASLRGHSSENPGYEQNKHIGHLLIEVAPHFRRRGLGKALARVASDVAQAEQLWTLQEFTNCQAGREFCTALGGKIAIEGSTNLLKLDEVDWEMISQWMAEGPQRAEGVELEIFNKVPESDLEDYCVIYTETMNQQPMGEVEGEVIVDGARRRNDEARAQKNKIEWITMISREHDGTISGLTEMLRIETDVHRFWQQLTGVKDQYRGRGLGKWLKASMLTHIRKNYPKVKMIMTANADENVPMLSINNRLGFKRYLNGAEVKIELERLQHHLNG